MGQLRDVDKARSRSGYDNEGAQRLMRKSFYAVRPTGVSGEMESKKIQRAAGSFKFCHSGIFFIRLLKKIKCAV